MALNKQIEVELRAQIDSDLLEVKGYTLSNLSKEHDIYYSYESDLNRTWIVRIRNKNAKYFLTFKSSKKFGDGAWDEVNMNIPEEKATQLEYFFLNNGFFVDVEIDKTRKTYHIDSMEVNIDEIVNLGTFIEAEIICTDSSQIDLAKSKIQKFFNSLGITPDKIINKGYVPLMRERVHGNNS